MFPVIALVSYCSTKKAAMSDLGLLSVQRLALWYTAARLVDKLLDFLLVIPSPETASLFPL